MSDDTVMEQPKRGRPPRQEEVKRERRRRGRVGGEASLRLYVPPEYKAHWSNYELRWINDNRGRLHQKTKNDDWDICYSHELPGAEPLTGDGPGTAITANAVGVGGDGKAYPAYLCRKPKDYYEADKRAEQEEIDKQENAVLKYEKPAGPGGLTIGADEDNAYVPSQR